MKGNQKVLLTVLIASIIITSIHYTHNAIFVDVYPEPDWFTTSGVFMTWIVMSLVGIVGYWLYTQKKILLSYLCLAIYSLTGLSSSAHYLYGGMLDFSIMMHAFIWSDVLAGLIVLGFVFWSGLLLKEWQEKKA